jgi:hypothetical protein
LESKQCPRHDIWGTSRIVCARALQIDKKLVWPCQRTGRADNYFAPAKLHFLFPVLRRTVHRLFPCFVEMARPRAKRDTLELILCVLTRIVKLT